MSEQETDARLADLFDRLEALGWHKMHTTPADGTYAFSIEGYWIEGSGEWGPVIESMETVEVDFSDPIVIAAYDAVRQWQSGPASDREDARSPSDVLRDLARADRVTVGLFREIGTILGLSREEIGAAALSFPASDGVSVPYTNDPPIRRAKDPEIDDAISRLVVCAYRRTQAEGGETHTECDYWANEQWAAREALVDKIESGPVSDRDQTEIPKETVRHVDVLVDYEPHERPSVARLQRAYKAITKDDWDALAAGTEPR